MSTNKLDKLRDEYLRRGRIMSSAEQHRFGYPQDWRRIVTRFKTARAAYERELLRVRKAERRAMQEDDVAEARADDREDDRTLVRS